MMQYPTLAEIEDARESLGTLVLETPVWQWRNQDVIDTFGEETELFLKLELFQFTGTFKPRGALTVMRQLTKAQLERGVTAVSAGNHAIAVAFAAQMMDTSAKVVMPKSANPLRVSICRDYGAEVELVDDVTKAFARVEEIQAEERRFFVHPFEGKETILGTATVGLEFCRQVPNLDAIIVPIGGGGLCAGIATAVKQLQPDCRVYGVEPEGADTMHRSFGAGSPQAIDRVQTIADSLGAPYAAPYSFGLCRQFVDELVKIDDAEMRAAMVLLFQSMKLAVEPAGAAATAALWGPLREVLRNKRVGVLICGTNIDIDTFATLIRPISSEHGSL